MATVVIIFIIINIFAIVVREFCSPNSINLFQILKFLLHVILVKFLLSRNSWTNLRIFNLTGVVISLAKLQSLREQSLQDCLHFRHQVQV